MLTPERVPCLSALITLLVSTLCSLAPLHAQCDEIELNEKDKLTATVAAPEDRFGESVAVSGGVALIGAPRSFTGNPGFATVFRFDGETWQEEQVLTASDGVGENRFGFSVAIDHFAHVAGGPPSEPNRIVVGAPADQGARGAAYVYMFDGVTWNQQVKVVAYDGEPNDRFGTAVDLHGIEMIIGADGDDDAGTDAGAAYLFSGYGWGFDQKIIGSSTAAGDGFGRSVSVNSTNEVAVGAPFADDPQSNAGAVYVFQESASWSEVQKLTLPGASGEERFGYSTALRSRLAIGAPMDDTGGPSHGAVYVYQDTTSGFVVDSILTASDGEPGAWFGISVSYGYGLAVGAPAHDQSGVNSGKAYLYLSDGASGYDERRLSNSDGSPGDFLGYSVSAWSAWPASAGGVLVGASRENGNGTNAGAAYYFPTAPAILSSPQDHTGCWGETVTLDVDAVGAAPFTYEWYRNGDSVGSSNEPTRDVTLNGFSEGTWWVVVTDCLNFHSMSDPFELTLEAGFCPKHCGTETVQILGGMYLQSSVAMNGDRALVGSTGDAYLFRRQDGAWAFEAELLPNGESGDQYGWAVALHGDVALVGAPYNDAAGEDAGTAWIYSGLPWPQESLQLTGSDTVAGDRFGSAVGLSGDFAIVGAPGHGAQGTNGGAAYVFGFDGSSWTEEEKLVGSAVDSFDEFGWPIVLSGDLAFIGAPDDEGGGSVYVFRFDGASWVEEQRLAVPVLPQAWRFGRLISYSAGLLVISNTGLDSAIRLYEHVGGSWIEVDQLIPSEGSFAGSLAVGNDVVVVGNAGADGLLPNAGAAYVFRFDGNSWWETDKWFANEPAGSFGNSVAIQDDQVVIVDTNYRGSNIFGATYFFDLNAGGPLQDGGFDDPVGAAWCFTDESLDGDIDFSGGVAAVTGGDDGTSGSTHTFVEQTVSFPAAGDYVLAFEWSFASNDPTGQDGAFYDIVDSWTGVSVIEGPVFLSGVNGAFGVEEAYFAGPSTYRLRFGTLSVNNASGPGTSTFDTVTIIPPCPQSSNLACASVGDDVDLSWVNPGGLIMLQIYHDGFLLTTLPADATGFTHVGAPLGSHTYQVVGICGDVPSAVECTIDHAGCVPPVITTQPIGVSACVGEAFALAVAVTGVAPISYQWQRDGVPISGAALSSYIMPAATPADAGSYTVTITDACGVTASDAATVSVGSNCVTAYDLDLDSGETSVLVPGGGAPDPLQVAYAEITNTSTTNDATVFVTKLDSISDPTSADFAVFGSTMQVTTSLADGGFFLRVIIPFTSADLAGGSPMDVHVLYHDGTGWRLAVEGNTAASPGHPGSVGDRFEVQSGVVPVLSSDLGDHGVFYDPSIDQGFGWANVDFNGDFAIGLEFVSPPGVLAAELIVESAPGDQFGNSVAIDGDAVIVGAFRDDDAGPNTGSAQLFRRQGTQWKHEQKINGSDSQANDFFGCSVAIAGNTAVVGAFQNDAVAPQAGAAHVFRLDDEEWSEAQMLIASDGQAGDLFGKSVAVSGSVIVVGAYLDDNAAGNAGAVYVFRHNGTNWIEEQKLTASDASAGDQFGWSVAVIGDEIVVGARLHDGGGTNSGALYFFRHDGDSWSQEQKLLSSAGDQLGYAVSFEGNRLVGGAPFHGETGAVFVYGREGSFWGQESTVLGSTPGDAFGFSLDLDGPLMAVGMLTDIDGLVDAGSVNVFQLVGSSWVAVLELTASIPGAGDRFGSALSLSGNRLAIGAPGDDDLGVDAGRVFIFE